MSITSQTPDDSNTDPESYTCWCSLHVPTSWHIQPVFMFLWYLDQFNILSSLDIRRYLYVLRPERGRQMTKHKPFEPSFDNNHFQDLINEGYRLQKLMITRHRGGKVKRSCDFSSDWSNWEITKKKGGRAVKSSITAEEMTLKPIMNSLVFLLNYSKFNNNFETSINMISHLELVHSATREHWYSLTRSTHLKHRITFLNK